LQLYRYCLHEEVTFTRGRAGKKNDGAYVEQKNWSVVRRAVGYYRYDTHEQLELLNCLYAVMHFYVNFFLPVMKLEEKTRVGSKVKRVRPVQLKLGLTSCESLWYHVRQNVPEEGNG